ncbi:MAG: phage tail protein [Bacteroidales bacterium]|nr:phage tail protein [Bacteroidales bacterium]
MEPYLGQISAFGFGFAPMGWVTCQGQLLNISEYDTLYSLIGTTFGGDGSTTFGVPDLRGRTIVGIGQGPGLANVAWGQKSGAETASLLNSNMPSHLHTFTNGDGTTPGTVNVTTYITTVNNTSESNESDGGNNGLGTGGTMPTIYRGTPSGADHIGGVTSSVSGATSVVGSSIPFGIRNPYMGIYYCIAVEGIWPQRS